MQVERRKMLEAEGLVTRAVFPTVPPTTEHALTDLGRGMGPVIHAMAGFGCGIAGAGGLDDLQGFAAPVLPIYPAWFWT